MSKGLGKMQRLILSSLGESRAWMRKRSDNTYGPFTFLSGKYWNHFPKENDPYLVRVNGEFFSLDDDTYDLSATLRFLAEKHGKMKDDGYRVEVSPKFRNSFWRAAKRLIQTGYLFRWRDDTNRIVAKGLLLEKIDAKCV